MTNDVPEWATPSFRGGRHAPLLSPLSQLTGILEDGLTVSTCHRPLLLLPQWVMWVKWLVGQVECSGGPMVRWCYGVVSVVLAPVKWLLMKTDDDQVESSINPHRRGSQDESFLVHKHLPQVVPECFNIVFTFKAKGTAEMMRLICVLPQNGGGTEEVE
uniref:HDC03016 n=1 Tax=Drosophila melanogaster TaxID=7227 RepID=Q6IH86_DROME|nr:TPA_inf: HDC03016 [Drosophila melanogaster]